MAISKLGIHHKYFLSTIAVLGIISSLLFFVLEFRVLDVDLGISEQALLYFFAGFTLLFGLVQLFSGSQAPKI